MSLDEAQHISEEGAEQLIVGMGQNGCVVLSDGADEFLGQNGCSGRLLPTPHAAMAWNVAKGGVIGMCHVTC